jgi:hypothetical protein
MVDSPAVLYTATSGARIPFHSSEVPGSVDRLLGDVVGNYQHLAS